jgi:hypothetical protein
VTDTTVERDVVDLLVQQHTQIRDLFTEVESSAAATRTSSFHRLVWLLAVHDAADEKVVHPLTRLHVHGGDYIVADLLAEERRTRQTLVALEEMGTDAPEFPRLLNELRTTVLEHANREEAYEFRYLRRDVPAGELRALSAVLKTAEAVAHTHPDPAVEAAPENTLALFDRTKELARKAVGDVLDPDTRSSATGKD